MSSLQVVFDAATAVATVAVPLVTIWGWRYVSRNERRLALIVDARDEMMKGMGLYLDHVRDLRDLLASDDVRMNCTSSQLLSDAESERHWVTMLGLRDYEAVFPQARPIREAIVQHHWELHDQAVAAAARSDRGERLQAAEALDEVVHAILVLRVALSNSVTRDLFIRAQYEVADAGARFGIIAKPSDFADDAGIGLRLGRALASTGARAYEWLLTGDSEHPELWTYRAPTVSGRDQLPRGPRRSRAYVEVALADGAADASALAGAGTSVRRG